MITGWKYTDINDHGAVLDRLAKNDFKVIDVGASDNPWSQDHLTATFDFKSSNLKSIRHFQGNLNDVQDWQQILDYVKEYGKFDFSICSHTLEDIAYPKVALEMLPKISKSGFISMPSHFQDLTRIEGNWPGYIHHRWLFVIKDGKLILVPKVPFTANLKVDAPQHASELQFFWSDSIPYEILNGDYLGPNVGCVITMYEYILDAVLVR